MANVQFNTELTEAADEQVVEIPAENLQATPAIEPQAEGIDPPKAEDDETEYEVVLADAEPNEPKDEPKPNSFYVKKRFEKKEQRKLTDENTLLRQQLDHARQQPVNEAPQVQPRPDEDDFDDRKEYLQADSNWQQQMFADAATKQLRQQQGANQLAVQKQQREAALETYAKNASKLKVSDFNEAQDSAFDTLGDEFAQMLATELPEEAPKLMYWFGKNPSEAARYREEFQLTPGRTTFSLGKLAGNLTIKPRSTDAAQPESKIENGSVGGVDTDWQSQLDKIIESSDKIGPNKSINQIRALKAKAKAAGFDVSTLK